MHHEIVKDSEESSSITALNKKIELRKVPAVNDWIDGSFDAKRIAEKI